MLPPPEHEGYGSTEGESAVELVERRKVAVEQNKLEWREAVSMSYVVSFHLYAASGTSHADITSIVLGLLSVILLMTLPSVPQHPILRKLATFCGLSATALAVCQYAPQIYKTYNARLVGALSLGTMAIQVPGSVLFCASIMLGEGTDWTSWLPYAITGVMQFSLLVGSKTVTNTRADSFSLQVICILWRRREKALGIDDFGEPLPEAEPSENERSALLGN